MENKNSPYDIINNGSVRIALIGALSILAIFLLAQTIAVAANFGRPSTPATDTITVQGSGQATLAPDVAHVSFSVENTAPAVADAQAATTKQANAAIAFVKEQGIAEKDIKTLSYTIFPEYAYPTPVVCSAMKCPPPQPAKVTGYRVSETIQVTVRDLSKVGEFLGGLGKLSVQNVSGPDFALDDSTAGYAAARADAIAKARTQAMLLGEQLGVRVGKIVNFSESSNQYERPMYGLGVSSAKMADSATPVVPVGENTYTASVSVTYEIR